MPEDTGTRARSLAYRWFRENNPDSSHKEAWSFAQNNWQNFQNQSDGTDKAIGVPIQVNRSA